MDKLDSIFTTIFIDVDGSKQIAVAETKMVPLIPTVGTKIITDKHPNEYLVQEIEIFLSSKVEITVWVQEIK